LLASGGNVEAVDSSLRLVITGTGMLSDFVRVLDVDALIVRWAV
jgi:hypothetical protein